MVQALASPLAGLLGDRLNRCYIVSFGAILWGVMTVAIAASTTLAQVRPWWDMLRGWNAGPHGMLQRWALSDSAAAGVARSEPQRQALECRGGACGAVSRRVARLLSQRAMRHGRPAFRRNAAAQNGAEISPGCQHHTLQPSRGTAR